ncbi:MAG: hypothetical protein ABI119_03370 [Gemmatimonadaceae bacterium]
MTFDESKHPRNKDGEWTDKGGGGPHDAETPGDISVPGGYAYHATNLKALRGIAKLGRLMARLPRQGVWADGTEGKRIYFNGGPSTGANYFGHYSPTGGRQVFLRVKATEPSLHNEMLSGFIVSNKSIPADRVEYLAHDGTWRPVTKSSVAKVGRGLVGRAHAGPASSGGVVSKAHNRIGHSGVVKHR